MSNKYSSATSAVIPGSGTMFNEATHIKPTRNRINENTNTYAVTVPRHIVSSACKACPISIKRKVRKSSKSKSRKSKK